MNTHTDKTQENKSQSVANTVSQKQSGESTFQFEDNRPEAIAQRKLQEMANNSPQVSQLRAFQDMANKNSQAKLTAQFQSMAGNSSSQKQQPIQKKENKTGLPDNLKTGMENLSGMSLDEVKVHRNSDKPAQLQAHAYAQGTDIHLGPGQEKHLPHETWHVVQQKQGRVKPTMQLKGKVNVNDDAGLEKEADVMGAKALQMKVDDNLNKSRSSAVDSNNVQPIQRKVLVKGSAYTPESGEDVSSEFKNAIEDEFLRCYESKEEAIGHIDNKVPGNFGLIKSRALWYRIPYLTDRFFVFGEYHSAVKGSQIKAASNITAPILDEARSGWDVAEVEGDSLESVQDAGLDENSSKLLRALEMWQSQVHRAPVGGVVGAPDLPKIPKGDTSTREERGGTKRLIVHGEDGNEEYWKQSGAQAPPPNTYDAQAEMLVAIKALFKIVFAAEIKSNNFNALPNGNRLSKSWGYFENESWKGHQSEVAIKKNVANYLCDGVKHKTSQEYTKLDSTPHLGNISTEDRSGWSADNYRDEFMFVRLLEAKKAGSFAFANMGNAHLERLKERLTVKDIPYILVDDFFGSYSKDAVDTKAIAQKNSPEFRENQRLVLWLKGAFLEYPNLQQMHLDMLNEKDLGEFLITGHVTKWNGDSEPSGKGHHQPILQQYLRDLKMAYPNSDDFIKDMSFEEFGEFLLTEKIAKWDAM
jgi:hypothetical protein